MRGEPCWRLPFTNNVSRETMVSVEIANQVEILKSGLQKLGLSYTSLQMDQFRAYLELLLNWNRRINLFSAQDAPRLAQRHLLESVAWTRHLSPAFGSTVMDLGSGAGFPGVPLKILRPDLELTLLESKRKKAIFLKEVRDALKLSGIEIVCARAEELRELPQWQEKFDWIIARAVASLDKLLKWSWPLLKPGGQLLSFKGSRLVTELKQINKLRNKRLIFEINVLNYSTGLGNDQEASLRKIVLITKPSRAQIQ